MADFEPTGCGQSPDLESTQRESDGNAWLADILRRRSLKDFETFFERFEKDRRFVLSFNLKPLLGTWWLSHFKRPHLLWIYDHMRSMWSFDTPDRVANILGLRIPTSRRALFYHLIFTGHYESDFSHSPPPPFWWDNRFLWKEYLEGVRCEDLEHMQLREKLAFIRRLSLFPRPGFKVSAALSAAIRADSVSVFEMTRQLENRRIGDALMQFLILTRAAKCFTYLVSHYPQQVFKLRSPEEWLITVCRYAEDEFAAAAADELERQVPGIVGRTRDPWGNTPLWNTFFDPDLELSFFLCWFNKQLRNMRIPGAVGKAKLRAALIRLGCDPDAKNAWGLSYRLLKENEPPPAAE